MTLPRTPTEWEALKTAINAEWTVINAEWPAIDAEWTAINAEWPAIDKEWTAIDAEWRTLGKAFEAKRTQGRSNATREEKIDLGTQPKPEEATTPPESPTEW